MQCSNNQLMTRELAPSTRERKLHFEHQWVLIGRTGGTADCDNTHPLLLDSTLFSSNGLIDSLSI